MGSAGLTANSQADLVFTAINHGADTQVTGINSAAGDALILKGVDTMTAAAAHYTFDRPASA